MSNLLPTSVVTDFVQNCSQKITYVLKPVNTTIHNQRYHSRNIYSRGHKNGYVVFNQHDSSTMQLFSFVCEE